MPEAVPTRNVAPVFACFVPDPVAVVAKTNAATISGTAANHLLLSSPSLVCVRERRLVHRQRACVRIERTTDTQRDGSLVLAVPKRELVERRDPERFEVLLEHVLDRLRRAPVGDLARQVAVVALVHVAHGDP